MKPEDFKTEKTASKNLNEEKYRQSENDEFEAFERVIIFLLYTLFEINFSNRWVTSLSKKILSEDFSNGILDEKWPIMMILEIFFLPIAGYKPAKGLFWSNMWETLSYKF